MFLPDPSKADTRGLRAALPTMVDPNSVEEKELRAQVDKALTADLNAGPYWVVTVTEHDDTDALTEACLAPFPGVKLPSLHEVLSAGQLGEVTVHLVPDAVYGILDELRFAGDLRLDDYTLIKVEDPTAGEQALRDSLRMQLTHPHREGSDELAAAAMAAVDQVGISGVARFLLSSPTPPYPQSLAGVATALTAFALPAQR